MGMIMNALSGPPRQDPVRSSCTFFRSLRSHLSTQVMQQRYTDRRQILNQNQGRVPPNMAGPMYPAGGMMMYAPPPMPYAGRHAYRDASRDARRCGRDARREQRRNAKAVRRAIKRGYPVPPQFMGQQQQPGYGQAPLFGYRGYGY